MSPMDPSSGLSLNLNLHPSAQKRAEEESIRIEEGGNLMEVISRIDRESRRMTQMVADMFDKYSLMHNELMDLMINSDNLQRKRKGDDLEDMSDGNCCKRIRMINCKPKLTKAFIQVQPSDTSLVVKDGYQWRKYGQKVTRDNPSPRAYFKCSFAPTCPVKKKVQKSVEDPTVLVATYEGEHNHKRPCNVGKLIIPSSLVSPSSYNSSPSPSTLDPLVHQNPSESNHKDRGGSDEEDNEDQPTRNPLEHWLVEQMASSLTKDPSFASTLALAISDKVLEHTFC